MQLSKDENSIPEVRKQALRFPNPRDPIEQLPRAGEAVQVFSMRAEHTLLRGSMFRTQWTPHPSCRLCGFVSSRLRMSSFRARPWMWSEIHPCKSFRGGGGGVILRCSFGARWLNSRQRSKDDRNISSQG